MRNWGSLTEKDNSFMFFDFLFLNKKCSYSPVSQTTGILCKWFDKFTRFCGEKKDLSESL